MLSSHIYRNFNNKSNYYVMKYIKFDYKNSNYNLIQCWKANLNNYFKIFNIDFIVNKRLDYIKINNLSINNDFYHNNKTDYENECYYKCRKVILENNLMINKNKFYVDIEMNNNNIQLNKIIVDNTIIRNNEYKLYNYKFEKKIDNNEYKMIKKIIFSNLCAYAKYKDINNIFMTINNNKRRYYAELKEEGFIIDNNSETNDDENLNIILKI